MGKRGWVCAAAIVAAACGGGSGGGDGAGASGGSASDATCDAFVTVVCAKNAQCSSYGLSTTYGDDATCRARAKIGCLTSMALPGSGATPEALAACAQALPGASCAGAPPACTPPGQLADGTSCSSSVQCKNGLCQKGANGGPCGVCKSQVALGAVCTVGSDCAGTDVTCSAGICAQRPTAGAACSPSLQCASGLTCVGNPGKCAQYAKLGEKCDPTNSAGPDCHLADGAACIAHICTQVLYATAGQKCGLMANSVTACTKGTCTPANVCSAVKADGDACGQGDLCLAPASCLSGHCTLPDPNTCK